MKVTDSDPTAFQRLINDAVQGKALDLNDANLTASSDELSIRKIYKVPASSQIPQKIPRVRLDERRDLELSILGLMALRGVT